MTLVGSGSGEVHIPFLGQSQAEGKHNKGKAHTKFLQSPYMYILLELPIVTECPTQVQQSIAGLSTSENLGPPHKAELSHSGIRLGCPDTPPYPPRLLTAQYMSLKDRLTPQYIS